jgi:uncharacterized protein (TIGR00661 family)
MNSKNFILMVQGEGRGHLTQAIAAYEILIRQGHTVSCVIAGSSSRRELPGFFYRKINAPIVTVCSPNFVTDKKNKSIRVGKSIFKNLLSVFKFRKSLCIIHKLIKFHRPDVVINFYEPLAGIYTATHRHSFKLVSVAHQYIYLHRDFVFPEEKWLQQQSVINYSRMTALGSDFILALSFYQLPQARNKKLLISPPLLRREIFDLPVTQENFLLVYLVNSGYMKEITAWHQQHPEEKLHCFTDCKEVKEKYNGEWRVDETLTFHSLDDKKFLALLGSCKGLVCTAGFESVCEAMYLGKPVMMVPVEGHFEQYCNARDAHKAGAGIHDESFRLKKFLDYIPFHHNKNLSYRKWVEGIERVLINAIEQVTGEYGPAAPPVKPPRIEVLRKVS